MKIYLIGMPGSGKNTIGKKLAKAIEYKFIDLDGIIARDALMFIDEIIEKDGRQKYQELETQSLLKVKDETKSVIACGEGIVDVFKNKQLMDGIVILLDVEIDILGERLENEFYREILKEKTLQQVSDERFLKYRNFATVIISNNTTINAAVEKIVEYLKNNI